MKDTTPSLHLKEHLSEYLPYIKSTKPVEEFEDRNRLCNANEMLMYSAHHPESQTIMKQ